MHLRDERESKTLSYKHIIYATLIVLVIFLFYWPTLRWLVNSWLSSDYYSYGFLVPLVSGVIIWTKREGLKRKVPSLVGIFWLLVAAGVYALDIVLEIRVLGALSLLSLIAGLIWLIWGIRAVKNLAFPLIFLLFLVPFPFIPSLAYQLQEASIWSSIHLLEALGFPVNSEGALIHVGDAVFTVGISCGGINTLVALLALTAVYAYTLKGSFARRCSLFVLAFPIAVITNILRIMSIIIVGYFYSVQTAAGWYHDISSPLFFLLAFSAVILIGRIMKCKINSALLRG